MIKYSSVTPLFQFLLSLMLITLFAGCETAYAQSVKLLTERAGVSLRGLSVVDKQTIWVSGSKGTVGRSLDGGVSWKWITVPGFEKNDFRDIEAFDKTTAVIMAIGSPAYILRTHDAGATWYTTFQDTTSAMFLDAMEFWNERSGIVIGDPVDGRFFIARTFDGGRSWQPLPFDKRPLADSGEACFASSGSNIRKLSKAEATFVSGGLSSNIFLREKKYKIPFSVPSESVGANSLAIKNNKTMMVVGGDFNLKNDRTNNCFITVNGGADWRIPVVSPKGYRSSVEYIGKARWICTGLNGIDVSKDEGSSWQPVSTDGFHVVRKAKHGKAIFLAGGNGRIAQFSW